MAKQTLILPQQKTFFFPYSKSSVEIDQEVNAWLKDMVLKGHHPSPTGPSVVSDPDVGTTIVYMYATTIEK